MKPSHPARTLSFMQRKPDGEGIDYWNVGTTASYSTDCERGRGLADEFVRFLGDNPTYGNTTLLGPIVLDMITDPPAKGLVIGFMAVINEYILSVARLMKEMGPKPAPELGTMDEALERYDAADKAYLKAWAADPQSEHEDLWNAKELAEEAVIRHPCQDHDDVCKKVRLILSDGNIYDSIDKCRIGEEMALPIFLRSLLGTPPSAPTTPVDESGQSAGLASVDKSNSGDN
jgi:hypothetical protein